MKVVLASNNAKKLKELGEILTPLGWELIAQEQLGVPECAEPHCTFVENALEKARHAARLTGLPALADDSGLCVAALGGAPGVQSARYAQGASDGIKSDSRNNEKLLAELAGQTDRRAHFVSLIVFVRHADDPQPIIAEGEWHGEIAHEEVGDGGFGYDPLFWLPDFGKTSAQLEREQKHAISHRGKALRVLLDKLKS